MIILSAGTLSKRMPEEKGISKRTHYYVMRLENDKLNVQGMNYHVDSKSFVPNKASVKRIPIDPVARYEVEYTYVVKPNGDLAGEGVAYCKAKPGRRLEDYIFGFGVDGKSPAVTSISDCNLAVTRNGAPMDLAKIVIQKNDPREKLCKVVIDPPITEMEEKITWSYVWKGGWQNLIGKGVDEGGFFIERRTDALRVRFKTGHERLKFKKIEITYENEETVKLLRHAEDQVGFEIENPRKYYTVGYKLEMR